jgi:hypothetical protein
MSKPQNREDVPFLLFLVPFAVSGLYAIYLWAQAGISSTLPASVFLEVTENPYVFLVGFVAVIFGAIIDVLQEEPAQRRAKLIRESNTVQIVAVAALVLGALCAWYAAGFNISAAGSDILQGRYVIVFPALLVAFSFLMLPSVTLRRDQTKNVLTVVLLLAVPLSIDEIGKRSFFAGIGVGIVLLIAAIYLYIQGQGPPSKPA